MKIKLFSVLFGVLLLSIVLFAQEDKPARAKECCFVRTGYQGTCRVTPGQDETCATILKYLNTPGTVGKSYCGGSRLRGGWKQIACE